MWQNKRIDDLVEALNPISPLPVAKSQEEADLWFSNPLLLCHKKMECVKSLTDEARVLIPDALDEWAMREKAFLGVLKLDRDGFIEVFEAIRSAAHDDQFDFHKIAIKYQTMCSQMVRNMSWVAAFVCVLPVSDPTNCLSHRRIGQIMAAIFYLEGLCKHSHTQYDNFTSSMAKLEAYYQISLEH